MITELHAAQIENRCTGCPSPYNRQVHRPPEDERILGDSDFVKRVLAQAKEDFERKHQLQSEGIGFEHVVIRVAELLELAPEQVLACGKFQQTVAARSLLCFWATSALAISQVELGQKLKISQPAVSMAVKRAEQLASRNSYSLKD